MNPEQQKFQKQFTDKEWSKLCADAEFNKAWEAGNMVKAGERSGIVIHGNAGNVNSMRTKRLINDALEGLLE